jgi:hypothetical protein
LGEGEPGATDVYGGAVTNSTTAQNISIPANGVTLFARLYYRLNGMWNWVDATYMEMGTSAPPALTTPKPGSMLADGNPTFTWQPGKGVQGYRFKLGKYGTGSNDIYDSGIITTTSVQPPDGIPTAGANIFARLSYKMNGVWQNLDYTYTEPGTTDLPVMILPTPSTKLTDSLVNFHWIGCQACTYYDLKVGTLGPGTSDVDASGIIKIPARLNVQVPSNGANLYVRLRYQINGIWSYIDYVYTEPGTVVRPQLTTPAPGIKLTGNLVTFSWTPGAGPTRYRFTLGATGVGSTDIYYGAPTTATSAINIPVPMNGVTLFATLYYQLNLEWKQINYKYTEDGTSSPPRLTNPTPKTTLPAGSVVFRWDPGVGATGFNTRLGTTAPGSSDLGADMATKGNTRIAFIPANGKKVYFRLSYMMNGVWKAIDYTYQEP